MMTFWMKTVNTEKALESHISEILDTLEMDYHDWWLLQTKFFQIRILSRSFVESFKRFLQIFKTFKIEAQKRNYFILKPQVNCRNISAVNQQWAKLSYFINTQ